jgi:hypothetical protein
MVDSLTQNREREKTVNIGREELAGLAIQHDLVTIESITLTT